MTSTSDKEDGRDSRDAAPDTSPAGEPGTSTSESAANARPAPAANGPTGAGAPADEGGAAKQHGEKTEEQKRRDQQTKLLIGFLLLVATVVVTAFWFDTFRAAANRASSESRVEWAPGDKQSLAPGPDGFFFDPAENELVYRGQMSQSTRTEISGLLVEDGSPVSPLAESATDYRYAVDQLGFESNRNNVDALVYLLLAGGLTGALGGVLRAIGNFVGNAAFKKDGWDPGRWWPTYISRPLLGFLFGFVIILIVSAGLLNLEGQASASVLWWLAIAFLAGFGSNEFQERLRSIAKAIFGETKKPDESERPPPAGAPDPAGDADAGEPSPEPEAPRPTRGPSGPATRTPQ